MNIREAILAESKNHFRELDDERRKKYGEVFTPTELVIEMISHLPRETWEEGKTFLDPTCGNGQFLAPVLLMKMRLGHKSPLSTIYGADIMQDNVKECRERLLAIAGDNPENQNIVKKNIQCRDGLTWDYSFGGPQDL